MDCNTEVKCEACQREADREHWIRVIEYHGMECVEVRRPPWSQAAALYVFKLYAEVGSPTVEVPAHQLEMVAQFVRSARQFGAEYHRLTGGDGS